MLLWSLDETARQLGGVSISSVRRMVERGDISSVHVGRLVRVVPESVQTYVACNASQVHNSPRVGSVACKGDDPCHTEEKTHLIGGSSTPTQAANQLTDLLEQLTAKKQKHSKQSGDLRCIN